MPDTGTTMGRIAVEFTVANHRDVVMARLGGLDFDRVRRVTLNGVVATDTMRLVLPESVVNQLGLTTFADSRSATRSMVKDVSVELLGRQGVFTAFVEPSRLTALIGAIVMEDLDFLVDCSTQTLQPRDPNGIFGEIE